MAIRVAEITRIAYLDEPLWYYRRHPDSQSGKYSRRRWETGLVILKKACRRRKYGFHVWRKRSAVLNFRLGQCLIEERLFIRSAGRFLLAGLLDPIRSIKVVIGAERRGSPH